MSVDDPPGYSEKQWNNQQNEKEIEYFVTIKHGNLFTAHPTFYPLKEKSTVKKYCQDSGTELTGFRFLQPVTLRSLRKFFSLPIRPGVPDCDSAASNFSYNLWYFQLNYAVLLALVVLIAIQWIHCQQFTVEVYFTIVAMGLLCMICSFGYQVKALGRKVRLSEQFIAIVTFMVLYNGFLPEAFDFIYFVGGYVIFVVIHASINQVAMFNHMAFPVHHI